MGTYTYKGKLWSRCQTTTGNNNFFHAVFGMKTDVGEVYFDKKAKFRRMRWAAFLAYFENEQMPPSLTDMLTKCLAANDNCEHVSIEDEENFDQYVSDVMAGEQSVTKEEIPILATLENVRIAVLLDGKPDPFILVKPSPDILGSYQNVSGKLKEVVLCLEGNTFSRLELLHEDSSPKCKKNKVEKKTDPSKYRKGGSAGSIGTDYQVSLLALVILNALRKELAQWKLSTENDDAGKFDDIVLEWSEGTVLIQSKHKEDHKKMITLEELTSTNTKHDDFSLPKYFLWFQVVKAKFNIKNVIICTNAGVHKNALKCLDPQDNNSESVLHYENGNCSVYTLNEKVLLDLKEKTLLYYQQNFKDKGIEESVITIENLKEFRKQLELYFNYPSLESLTKIIERLLSLTKASSNSQIKITPLEMHSKVRDWFQQKEGVYLTDIHAKALFSEILRDKYCQILEQYKVFFEKKTDLNFQGTKQVLYVTAKYGYLLPVIKIYRTMHDNQSQILYVNPDYDIHAQKQVVEAFGLPQYVYLVIICPKTTEEPVTVDIYGKLKDLLEARKYKRIVLVAEDSKLAQQIGMTDVINVDKPVTFEDLSSVSKDMLLKKNVIFQGKTVSLEDILETQTGEAYTHVLNPEVLEKIIVEEQVKVGEPPQDLDEYVKRYYINRTFKRECDKMQEEEFDKTQEDDQNSEEMEESVADEMEFSDITEHLKSQWTEGEINGENQMLNDDKKEETFPEEMIYNVDEKLIVIADSAGMGKSTVLIKLATTIKKNNPRLWVVRIELNDYTKILREFDKKGRETISIKEMLDSENETKLTNHLEKRLFSSNQKVVLMLDGIDEISPDYTGLILSLIKRCYEESNFTKIFVTTRTHMAKELEAVLKVRSFVLQPFTEENQVEFLTNYWADNLQLEDEASKDKCKRYAKALINNVLWTNLETNKENHFASLPLHVRMTAEIFQENTRLDDSTDWGGCREYVTGDEAEPKFTQTMNVTKLYDLFIERKQGIFMDKGNPTGNPAANRALKEQFNECLVYHRSLALEVILGEDKFRYFSSYQRGDENTETNLLKIGIVQKFGDNFHFVHRTFADYFLAEILHMELQQNQTLEFQKFLIDTIFLEPQYNVTRIFFDSFLRKIVHSLPFNIFENYQSANQESSSELCTLQSKLIHTLAEEGCLAILQLLLKCVDFQLITDKEISAVGLYETEFDENVRENIFGNTLNVLKYLTGQVGVNIKDQEGSNPLHCAARRGRIEMVKFLIERGANVDCRNDNGDTAIHMAIRNGGLQTIDYLVQQGLDVNIKNNYGFAPIYSAARFGRVDILKLLIERGADFNTTNDNRRTLVHSASANGHLETVEFLLELGIDCDIPDKDGSTALYLAVRFGHLDTVKLLVGYTSDFNKTNNTGRTLLHSASAHGHLKVVKVLIELGVNATTTDGDGYTVLHLAARFGHLETVKFLVEYGLDFKVTNNNGRTLLHSACANGHLETVKFLLELGVDFKIRNNNGHTALHTAAHFGRLETVKFLVEYGLDFKVTNKDGRTLLHSASITGHLETVKFVLGLGVDGQIRDNSGYSTLHQAARFGHLNLVKFLIEYGLDFNVTNNDGRTLLHSASLHGRLETIKFLLGLGVEFEIKDDDGYTALQTATYFGKLETVKFLVEYGSDLNVINNKGRTLLHSASTKGHLEIIKFLLQLGDFNMLDKDGHTPLHLAARGGHLDTVKFLLEYDPDFNVTNDNGQTLLHSASANGHLETVKFLVELWDASNVLDNDGYTPLQLAARGGHLDTIKFLVGYCPDLNITNSDGRTLLHSASGKGHLEAVKFLLELGVDFKIEDNGGYTPLQRATYFGRLETVKFLVEYGLDCKIINNNGHTLLHTASVKGHLELVKYFLELTDDCSIRDNNGHTALHLAARFGRLHVVKFLEEYGLDVNVTNNKGCSALDSASANGHLDIVKFLVEVGADCTTKDNDGYTILQTAAYYGKLKTVKYFVEYGLDFNVTANNGRTPLHSASAKGHLETVKFLLQCADDFNVLDNGGYTALHLAARFGHLDTVKFLVEYGLDFNVTNNKGRTLAHSASANGHLETIKFLLGLGVDFNVRNKEGYTVIQTAAFLGRLKIVKYLVGCGLDYNVTNNSGRTLLHTASAKGHLETVKFLVRLIDDCNTSDNDGCTALHLAARFGHLETVKFLVKYGLDSRVTNNTGQTLLHSAVANGHLTVVKFLLQIGGDLEIKDNEGCNALQIAVSFGRLDVVKFLMGHSKDVNITESHDRTLLHLAATKGHLETIEYLFELGVDTQIRDDNGYTALHIAARLGHLDIIKFLVEYGLDSKVTDKNGRTLVHLASINGHLETVKFLIELGVDVKAIDEDGCTALHLAAHFGYLDTVKLLVEYGLDSKVTNKNGRTLLHSASANGHLETVKFLIELGIDVNITDEDGCTALQLAVHFGHLDIVEFLKFQHLETVKFFSKPDTIDEDGPKVQK